MTPALLGTGLGLLGGGGLWLAATGTPMARRPRLDDRLALAAPWLILLLLSTRPQAVAAYNQPAGAVVLAGGAAVSFVAYRVMLRIARLPTERRVLK